MSGQAKDLRIARLFTMSHVETILRNHSIERVASHLLTAAPSLFAIPYFNSPLMSPLRAESDRALIWVHTVLSGTSLCATCRTAGKKLGSCIKPRCGKSLADGMPIRGLDLLRNHRDVVCHPITHQLYRRKLREFLDDDRESDPLPAIIWDIHRSINELLAAAGDPHPDLNEFLGAGTSAVLSSLLAFCWKPGVEAAGEAALMGWLNQAWSIDRIAFEKHPDGRFPRKTKTEYREMWAERIRAWNQSR